MNQYVSAILLLFALCAAVPVMAQTHHHGSGETTNTANDDTNDRRDPHAYANGLIRHHGADATTHTQQLHLASGDPFATLHVDRLEGWHSRIDNGEVFEGQWSYGTPYDKLLFKFEGEAKNGKLEATHSDILWNHAIAAYWDGQLGLRLDRNTAVNRQWLALGIEGITPYWLDVAATAYLGENGRTALRFTASYDLLLSQKLILQPRVEIAAYSKQDAINHIGSGLATSTLALRLRYAFSRKFAPYLGVERVQSWGKTASLARDQGDSTGDTRWLAGVRFWF